LRRSVRILADEQTDQLARRGRHGDVREIVRGHEFRHLVDGHVRSESARAGAHDGLDSDISFPAEFFGTEEPHDDARLIDHDAGIPPSCSNSFPNVPEGVLETARRHVPARDRRGSRSAGSRAVSRESSR